MINNFFHPVPNPSLGVYIRLALEIGTGVCFLVLLIATLVSWRHMSMGQKLFLTSALGYQLYIVGALRKAIQKGLVFDPILIPLVIGALCMAMYLLEPKKLTKARRGKDMMAPADEDQPLKQPRSEPKSHGKWSDRFMGVWRHL